MVRGAVLRMQLAKPRWKHTVLRDTAEDAVGAEDGCIDRTRQDENTDHHDKTVKGEPEPEGPCKHHREAADQVVENIGALRIRDQHDGEEGDQRGKEHAVEEDDQACAQKVLPLRRFDLAIYLGQRLFAAERKHGMAEPDSDGHHGEAGQGRALQPAQRAFAEMEV